MLFPYRTILIKFWRLLCMTIPACLAPKIKPWPNSLMRCFPHTDGWLPNMAGVCLILRNRLLPHNWPIVWMSRWAGVPNKVLGDCTWLWVNKGGSDLTSFPIAPSVWLLHSKNIWSFSLLTVSWHWVSVWLQWGEKETHLKHDKQVPPTRLHNLSGICQNACSLKQYTGTEINDVM